ncbi:hypothetical protein PaG_00239 [Moesziomyces aphidis]|jgi:hypothetical protein|uniref:Uncharacterized protein n=1 Tax=Moesziomyces aphidis TaxID=84754 RepID=W3VUF1_MOEAP|nr:hypothetical protein PaG_00239 [Moesziomyces aphidis]
MTGIPITAGGAGTDYERTFKKHFGDRPTAFALSEHARASTSAQPLGEDAVCGSTNSNTVRAGRVDEETHSKLQNLGYRIRARVNQGYNRTTTSLDPFGSSEGQILSNVTNTRRAWSRVQSAPASKDFDTLKSLRSHTDTHNVTQGAKRSRDDSDEEPERTESNFDRRIAAMPALSFASTASSNSSLGDPPQTSWTRSHSSTQPFAIQDTDMPDSKLEYDFSTHFNSTDF